MRKLGLILTGVCLVVLLGLTGCAGKEKKTDAQGKESGTVPVLTEEDFHPGNATVFQTEKGYYYYGAREPGFRYYDSATGKDMYLCNKPECRHDGNEFCVATNEKYVIERVGMYGGRLWATAVEETDTQFLFHLISVAPDGSELNEYVTYLTIEKTGVIPGSHMGGSQLFLHRNVALIPLGLMGDDGTGTTKYYGATVIRLDTKEVTYLDEEPFSVEYEPISNITAHGDYFYYCRKEGKKTVLHRYNIKDGSDEIHKLLVGFQGNYIVQDDNTIVYTKSGNYELCVFHRETGQNEEKVKLTEKQTVFYSDGTTGEQDVPYEAVDIKTDGEYIYVRDQYVRKVQHDEDFNEVAAWEEADIHIFDRELREVAWLNMAEVMKEYAKELRSDTEDFYYYFNRYMYYEKDAVYCMLHNVRDTSGDPVYRCTRESFLSGNPDFELAMIYK